MQPWGAAFFRTATPRCRSFHRISSFVVSRRTVIMLYGIRLHQIACLRYFAGGRRRAVIWWQYEETDFGSRFQSKTTVWRWIPMPMLGVHVNVRVRWTCPCLCPCQPKISKIGLTATRFTGFCQLLQTMPIQMLRRCWNWFYAPLVMVSL